MAHYRAEERSIVALEASLTGLKPTNSIGQTIYVTPIQSVVLYESFDLFKNILGLAFRKRQYI